MLNVKGLTKKVQALLGTGSWHAGFVLQHDKKLLTAVVKDENEWDNHPCISLFFSPVFWRRIKKNHVKTRHSVLRTAISIQGRQNWKAWTYHKLPAILDYKKLLVTAVVKDENEWENHPCISLFFSPVFWRRIKKIMSKRVIVFYVRQ